MNVNGSIPLHIARAYGVTPPAPRATPPSTSAPTPGATTAATTPGTAPNIAPATATSSTRVQGLVGGVVSGQATPPAAAPITAASKIAPTTGAYQLYARVADRIEAAVAVELGRSLDIKG